LLLLYGSQQTVQSPLPSSSSSAAAASFLLILFFTTTVFFLGAALALAFVMADAALAADAVEFVVADISGMASSGFTFDTGSCG
jgi:hypothetical protein